MLLDTVEEIGVEQPEAIARVAALFRSAFDEESGQRQTARLLREWSSARGAQRSPTPDSLTTTAQLIEAGQCEQAMQTAGLAQPGDWGDLFRWFFRTHSPTQSLVSGLVDLIRTTLTSAKQPQTAMSAVLDKLATALFSAFGTRDELVAFLKRDFNDVLPFLLLYGPYNDILVSVATFFEQRGRTELLIDRALAYQPDNPDLKVLKQQLDNATAITRGDILVQGDVTHAAISSYGSVMIQGDVVNTTITMFNRSAPREELDALPKAMPPFNATDLPGEYLAAPELVFNWALGMRQAMHAVCRVEVSQAIFTGFLIAPNLLLCPNYQLAQEEWHGARARFDYCHVPNGSEGNPTVYVLAEEGVVTVNKDIGYRLLRLEGMPGMDLVPGERVMRGWLSLTSVLVLPGQSLFMLHHGLGRPQMLEYATARKAIDGKIELTTLSGTNLPGSGGAPCCNENWQVVAIRLNKHIERRPEKSPLLSIWASDLLADAKFLYTLKQHLPEAQSGETDAAMRLARLRQTLIDNFTFEELQVLAFELGIDWQALSGQTRSEKAQSLIEYVDAQGKLDPLVHRCMEIRPQAKWK